MVLAKGLLEAIDLDRRWAHLLLVVRLVVEAFAFTAAALGVRWADAGGFAGAAVFRGSAATSVVGVLASVASEAVGSALATPMVLERVRWQVSHVTVVRTKVPRCRSSRRSVRGRAQKEQKATSVVTLTWPGRLFMSP